MNIKSYEYYETFLDINTKIIITNLIFANIVIPTNQKGYSYRMLSIKQHVFDTT